MKIKALTIIPLALLVIGCISCAGCTSLQAENLQADILSQLENLDESFADTSYSKGILEFDGKEVPYESNTADGTRVLVIGIDGNEYTLTAPARDDIIGIWSADNELTEAVFEEDGLGIFSSEDESLPDMFVWGKNADGTYRVIFLDRTEKTVALTQGVMTGLCAVPLTKHEPELDMSGSGDDYYYVSGTFSVDGKSISYESTSSAGGRELVATIDGKEYMLSASTDDPIFGIWNGADGRTSVTFEADGVGTFSDPATSVLQDFFWGRNADGSYRIVLTDSAEKTVTVSQGTLTGFTDGPLTKNSA